jgi:hypothetical protein
MHRSLRCVGKLKAVAAADKLNRILPAMEARAEVLGIPMPGHFVQTSGKEYDETVAAIHKLSALIAEHDVIFMLLDTREARWLPTVLSTLHEKVAVNAALGFDSYMVRAQPFHSFAAVLQPTQRCCLGTPVVRSDRPTTGDAPWRARRCHGAARLLLLQRRRVAEGLDHQPHTRPAVHCACAAAAAAVVSPLPHAVRAWVRHCR